MRRTEHAALDIERFAGQLLRFGIITITIFL
jgi:hypothetical protein